MKLSIIVPVYNVEPYLRRCVDSILGQTFTDFEVILVDDGSPDNCGTICDEYAAKDKRVRVIHQENGGISAARNAGLDIAQGDYIGFVDSDDYIFPNMYETLMNLADRYDADISACGIQNVDVEEKLIDEWPCLPCDTVYGRNDFIENFYPDTRRFLMPAVWNKIYKSGIFAQVRFPVQKIHEDEYIQMDLLEQSNIVVMSSKHLYCYRKAREGSILSSAYSVKNWDLIYVAERQLQFFYEKNILEQEEYAIDKYADAYMRNLVQVMLNHKDFQQRYKEYKIAFRCRLGKIVRSRKVCRMKKAIAILACSNERLACILYKKYFSI